MPPKSDVLTYDQMLGSLHYVLWAFLITAAVFVYCDWRFMSWRAFKWGMDETRFASALAMISMGAQILYLAVVVVGFQLLGSLTFLGVSFFTFMHFAAAVLLIVNLSFAAASHAFPTKLNKQIQGGKGAGAPHPTTQLALVAYRIITAFTWGGLVIGVICIANNVPYAVIWTEYFEIGMFLAYWLMATRRDWQSRI